METQSDKNDRAPNTGTPTNSQASNEEKNFAEFRRKVRAAEVLSAATQKLLQSIRFSGRLNILVANGQVLKSGYEENYFRNSGPGADAPLQ